MSSNDNIGGGGGRVIEAKSTKKAKPENKCKHCGHQFMQKSDLTKHLKKKNGCIPNAKIEATVSTTIAKIEANNASSNKIQEIHGLFKSCLDILRNDGSHLIGDEALNELSYFLILKQVEKHILNGNIDIYNLDHYDANAIQEYTEEDFLLNIEYIKFSKFVEYVRIPEKEIDLIRIFHEFMWEQILSKHPKFKDVFEPGRKSFIKYPKTIKKIVIALGEINFDEYDFDILGEAYESIFVDAVFGAGGNKKSELGQFFTPPKVKKMLINLVSPKIKENGEIESILDPASGTGGILNSVIKHYKQMGMADEVLREQLKNNVYGMEIKEKIFNLCLSNMLINTGEILPEVKCADSIRYFHNIKVDNIIANPPFSVTMDYTSLLQSLGNMERLNDYIPIKAGGKNSEILFLQMMMYCLNVGGKCATVMLDGQKMYGASAGYDKAREYLMRSCDLQQVILCPAGTFTSTASKTCVLFFTKKKERADTVEIIGDAKKRTYKFCKTHATKKVKFFDFNPDTEEKHFILEVDITQITEKKYSLNYTEYLEKEEEPEDAEGVEYVELGTVCEFKNGKNITKKDLTDGIYPVVGGGKSPLGMHNEYNVNENTILCASSGSAGFISKYNKKIWASDCFSINSKNTEELNETYLYYYLLTIQNKIYKLQNGAAQQHVYSKDVAKIKIPIISVEKQQRIVNYLDQLFLEDNKYSLQSVVEYYESGDMFKLLLMGHFTIFEKLVEWQYQSTEIENQIKFIKDKQSKYLQLMTYSTELKTLDTVCKVQQGTYITKIMKIDGAYPVYGGGDISSYINLYNREDEIIIAKDGVSLNCVRYEINKFFLNHHGWTLICKDIVIKKYLFYYLYSIQNKLLSIAKGAGQLGINQENFYKIKIPIPSLEVQNKIVEYCNHNDERIKQLETELIQNKELAKLFISQDFDKIQDIANEDATNEDATSEDATSEDANNEDANNEDANNEDANNEDAN